VGGAEAVHPDRAAAAVSRLGTWMVNLYVGHGEPWPDGVRSAVERVRAVGPT
jgi:hypothetical protein